MQRWEIPGPARTGSATGPDQGTTLENRLSLLALLNPSKAFLAVSAVLTGYCLLRFYAYTAGNILVVPYLLAAGALLSMADSAWRYVFSAAAGEHARDGEAPPDKSANAPFFFAAFLSLGGLMCAMTGGYNSFRLAGAFTVLMLARYALFRKWEVLYPFLGGLGQGLLLLLGMTAHPSFIEMVFIHEARLPVAFFTVYMVVASVLSQTRDSSRPRETQVEDLANDTASRLLDMRGDAVDRTVACFGGGVLILIPLLLGWIMPWQWLSWTFQIILALSILTKLIPVVVYRTRRDLSALVEAVYRGGAFLNAGGVASLGDYRLREIYAGWAIPLPGRDELVAVAIIALLSLPAWLLRRVGPAE